MPTLLRAAPFRGHAPSGTALYTGTSGTSAVVPHIFHVSLGGRPYIVDFSQPFYRQMRRQLAQITRTQADTSTDPGEQTLDPNAMWRRSFEDWSLGAGQLYLDRHDSVSNRYWTSKGVDTLTTRWQLTLLPDTVLSYATVNVGLQMVQAGAYVYLIDGQKVFYASAPAGPWTAVAGTPAVTCSSICTDGVDVWMAYAASGVYVTTAGSSSAATQYITSAVSTTAVLGYTNGRLMLANLNVLYNLTASGALPAALWTAGNPNTRFTCFAEGVGAVYAAGGVGNRHYIWGMQVTSDGTQLGAPVIQGQVPDGEQITSLYGYLDFLIVGTTTGVRMCTMATSGAVTLGALIPTPHAVQCLVGWDRFVYFGWTAYDSTSTGLGRMDLQNQVIAGVLPAYASDLMATGQQAVTGVVAWGNRICFGCDGAGLYTPSTVQLVAQGDVNSGIITYDLTDPKTAAQIDCAGPITDGAYTLSLATDGGAYKPVGTHRAGDPEPVTFSAGPTTGQRFSVDLILYRDPVNPIAPLTGPTFTRWTLRAYPAPHRPLQWQLPILINETVADITDGLNSFDPLIEVEALEDMAGRGEMVTYQEGPNAYLVFVTDVSFLPTYPTRDRNFFNGIALVTLQGLPPSGGN
jgi:hypothetical protein